MATTTPIPKTPVQNSQSNTRARPDQGLLVAPAVAGATNGLAAALEESAKARIQYTQ